MSERYQAILVVSFGGPEGPDEVMPFLENVVRGRPVPRERLLEVAEHYQHFGGVSPINGQNRALIAALEARLAQQGPKLPIYFGNRNWHPMLADTVRQMVDDGIANALAFVTSAFGSYSGCRQYQEDIERARQAIGSRAPTIDKLRVFYNHPGFIDASVDRVAEALAVVPEAVRAETPLVFTAHSIPCTMAAVSPYEAQLREACTLVAERLGHARWELVYQSRSGSPAQPWLGPDVCEWIRAIAATERPDSVVVAPIGFLSDHVEVLYDLDVEAQAVCDELGIKLCRAGTVGCHPRFVDTIGDLIIERSKRLATRAVIGAAPPWPDVCPPDCCLFDPATGRPRT